MDDMGWCPLCNALANIHKDENCGKCTHCNLSYCLDCKTRVHPFKRCAINRLDLLIEFKERLDAINEENVKNEKALT